GADRAAEAAAAPRVVGDRDVAVDRAAEAVEIQTPADAIAEAGLDASAERLDVERAPRVGDRDAAGERVDALAPADALDVHRAREHLDVEADVGRHLDVEIGLHDVVVALVPVGILFVRFDSDARAGLDDRELDVIEPGPIRAPDGVDGNVGSVGARD